MRFNTLRLNGRYLKWIFVIVCCYSVISLVSWIHLQLLVWDTAEHGLPQIRKFAFMKNHKCASSTIENIIFRYAHKNKLNVVLPAEGNYLSNVELFHHNTLRKAKWSRVPFDIFSLHCRWNRKEVMTTLGGEVPTFAIVRDPVDIFSSMFHYRDDFKQFYGVRDIHEFVRTVQETPFLPILKKRWMNYIGRNQMAWDMGLSPNIFDDTAAVQQEIERLDREFDLVMVAERMDESLILLKDLLNWPLTNVAYLSLNRRKPESTVTISQQEREILSSWLAADVMIYKHFVRRLDEKVARMNENNPSSWISEIFGLTYVKTQVKKLKELNRRLYNLCVVREAGNEELHGKFKETSNNIVGYVINEDVEDCSLYAMSEPAYLNIFKHSLLSKARRLRFEVATNIQNTTIKTQ